MWFLGVGGVVYGVEACVVIFEVYKGRNLLFGVEKHVNGGLPVIIDAGSEPTNQLEANLSQTREAPRTPRKLKSRNTIDEIRDQECQPKNEPDLGPNELVSPEADYQQKMSDSVEGKGHDYWKENLEESDDGGEDLGGQPESFNGQEVLEAGVGDHGGLEMEKVVGEVIDDPHVSE